MIKKTEKRFQKRLVKDTKIFLKKKTKSANMLVSDQGFYAPCFIIINDRGWDRCGLVDFYQSVGGGTRRGYFLVDIFLCFCSLVSLLLSDYSMIAALCLFLYLLFVFFVSGPFN